VDAPGKALVTGGAGFIGSYLSHELLERGWEVYALDDLSTGSVANVAPLRDHPRFHLVVESVLSPGVVSELVFKSDAVWHQAAAVGVRLIVEQPGRTLLTNVQGTETVLEYCARFDKPVLVASSSEVYGDHPETQQPLREDARRIYGPTTAKRWGYADSKALDEFLALALHEERGLRPVIVRLFNTVGPRFVRAALAGAPLEVHGDGTQTRCFCHVRDTVHALADVVERGDTWGEIFNVGSTEPVTILQLAERVKALTGSASELVFVPYDQVYGQGIEEMFQRIPATDKIRAVIGWEPTITLDEILAEVVEHTRRTAPREPAPAP
jgi:UDP-glucose 4-epimerase